MVRNTKVVFELNTPDPKVLFTLKNYVLSELQEAHVFKRRCSFTHTPTPEGFDLHVMWNRMTDGELDDARFALQSLLTSMIKQDKVKKLDITHD